MIFHEGTEVVDSLQACIDGVLHNLKLLFPDGPFKVVETVGV